LRVVGSPGRPGVPHFAGPGSTGFTGS